MQQVITRPNTGTSGHEMDLRELREKYERVPDEEASMVEVQQGWVEVNHDDTALLKTKWAI